MDNAFLQYLLFLCLALILIVYLYQNDKKMKHHKVKKTGQHINVTPKLHIDAYAAQAAHAAQAAPTFQNIPNQYTIFKNTGMPIHRVGPVINFHQHFNKYTTNPTYTTVKGCGSPTGIPELGWRNMYISNYTKDEVKIEDPFSGIVTRNYLDNMTNVDNIYRQ